MMRRRIEVVEGQPCGCVAKTDRERVADEWSIVCRACGETWWWGLVVDDPASLVLRVVRGRPTNPGRGPRTPAP